MFLAPDGAGAAPVKSRVSGEASSHVGGDFGQLGGRGQRGRRPRSAGEPRPQSAAPHPGRNSTEGRPRKVAGVLAAALHSSAARLRRSQGKPSSAPPLPPGRLLPGAGPSEPGALTPASAGYRAVVGCSLVSQRPRRRPRPPPCDGQLCQPVGRRAGRLAPPRCGSKEAATSGRGAFQKAAAYPCWTFHWSNRIIESDPTGLVGSPIG